MDKNLLIDASILANALGEDLAQVNKYMSLFMESTREGLVEIDAALDLANLQAAAAIGHRIKSAALTVGAIRFADLCQALENLKDSEDVEQGSEIVAEMHLMLTLIEEQVKSDS